jgi:tetratricopeptide (TPR) repeat protein
VKTFIHLLFLSLLITGLKAQRLNLDKYWFNYSYRRLPNIVLDKSFMTYSLNVSKTVALDAYSNESTNSKINIEGRKKLSSGGHFIVNISLDDLIIEQSEVKERVEIIKDKDGKETGRKTYYRVEVRYTFAAGANVKDFKGYTLSSYTMASRNDKKIYTSNEFYSYNDAANYFNNNKLEIKTKLVSEQINAALESLDSSLNSDFGYSIIRLREFLWDIGTKKHPEYVAFHEACTKVKTALEKITADGIPPECSDMLQPVIDYLVRIPENFTNIEEKADIKLRYGAYYNLAVIYLLTEQFEKAKDYAQKLISNDYDKGDGERIIKEADNLKAQFEKQQIFSRHFLPDYENAQPPQ